MSKVAAYLRGHISGEVVTREDVRSALSNDAGVLSIKPELVIYPRTTNDIRKIARFSWQLAEKGHVLPLTVRGAGTDSTGASIGKGAVLVTTAHMHKVFEYDAKQRRVRLQPGASIDAIQSALALGGTAIPSLEGSRGYGTIGGAIATAVTGPLAGKYGAIEGSIDQLEVVLANGDVIQTGRISKRELNRKKGLQGMEGDIYRGIDGVIDEYSETLSTLAANDATGYNTIADVKRKDGSFNLTPLFVGSQGTLGIISELILKADFKGGKTDYAALVFADADVARDALDALALLKPAILEYFDAELFDVAAKAGKSYKFYTDASQSNPAQSIVIIGFDEFNARHREKGIKRIKKLFEQKDGVYLSFQNDTSVDDVSAALDVLHYTLQPDQNGTASTTIFSGFHIPTAQLEKFAIALKEVSTHEHIVLPLAGHVITNTYGVYPSFSLGKVADKQKFLKLVDAITKLVYSHGGTMLAEGGEGRIKARSVYAELDEKVVEMYAAVRKVCDPLGTLNPGVKQVNDVRTIASQLQDAHSSADFARFGL